MIEPRTLAERYSSATDSSDLRLRELSSGDADVLIAAGLVPDGFAAALYRLQVEFDAQRAPLDAARRWASGRMALAAELRARADAEAARAEFGPIQSGHRAEWLATASMLQRDATETLRTEFSLALMRMRTLREARERLFAFADDLARRRRAPLGEFAVEALAHRVLGVFLDPHCPHCDGRGFSGGGRHEHSGPQHICRPCRGTGSRRDELGRDADERNFAGALLMSMDAALYEVQSAIARNARMVRIAKARIVAAAA